MISSDLVHEFHNDQLKNVIELVDLVNAGGKVVQRSLLGGGRERERDMMSCIQTTPLPLCLTLSTWISIMKAFLLQEASCSPSR